MNFIYGIIIGLIAGTLFSRLLIKLFKIGYKKIDKNVNHLDN